MVTIQTKKTHGFVEKTKGLIGAKSAYPLFLTTRFGIHTFFLKFSIDALILNNERVIVQTKEGLRPFRILFWNPKFKNIIELPSGMIEEKKMRVGEKIVIAE